MKKSAFLIISAFLLGTAFSQQAENNEHMFLKNTRQLIYDGLRSGEGYFSPDGNKLIFQSERDPENPFYQIYILDFETGDIHKVSPGSGKTTCSFFQGNGDRVMFSSSHLDPDALKKQKDELNFRASGEKRRYSWDYETTMDIFSTKQDGSDIQRLTNEKGYDAEGSYSPDGKLIVYSTNKDAYNRELTPGEHEQLVKDASYFCDLYIMNADGTNKKRLTTSPGYDGGPFFSPDGKRIIWRRFTTNGQAADVYTMNIDGTDEKRLTDFGCLSWAPYFHPSGDYIIWAANKMGYSNFELYITDAQGKKEPTRVTFTDGFDGLPVFSPDGTKLVLTSSRTDNGKAQLFIANWDDAAARAAIEKAPFRKISTGMNDHFKPGINADDLSELVSYLTSDDLNKRTDNPEGSTMAADYIANIFSDFGLNTLNDTPSYFHPYDFVSGISFHENNNTLHSGSIAFKLNQDFVPLAGSADGTLSAPVVFAGYGIRLIDGKDYIYDSYASIDVKDKIVMVLDGYPSNVNDAKKKTLSKL